MKRLSTDEARRAYLEFFRLKGHEIVASDSLAPKDDPTLLFTGAGMNQFKEQFLGRKVTYKCATTCQKCLRTGDLDNVGRTSGHHTLFEMLGNFSFGDYFKKEVIPWAWEFLTERLEIEKDRLWVSVYKDDPEAYAIWKDAVKIPAERIMKFGEKENFWPSEAPTKGPNGPCGPCSEIFFDYGKDVGCRKPDCTPVCDCGRFVEIWNLVFTQFDRQPDGSLRPLPNKNIDTGMGLERLTSVLQGVKTNFEIDTLARIVKEIEALSAHPARSKVNAIADHIRAVTFCIADGVMPSNEARGYVVRKLIRRSLVYARDLDIRMPFLYKLVTVVADVMKAQYPELIDRRDDIALVVKQEEENFINVIKTQLPKVEEAFEGLARTRPGALVEETAFTFYDTYGMPYDMLEEIAERHGVKIDKDAFEAFLDKQRELSRAKSKIKGEIFTETFAKKVEALGLKTDFLGYERTSAKATVIAVMDGGEVVLAATPFYGESGGQVGDHGAIVTPSGKMIVEDAKRIGSAIVHIGRMETGVVRKGETAEAVIDESVRADIMRNHTATHLLQAALRTVLGEHVHQTGSLVSREYLRFDFSHMKKLDERELARVEGLVNEAIRKSIAVNKETKNIEDAKRDGATALFGEKYDSVVRVVTIGTLSKELCGGTHVANTGEIKQFVITAERAVASGVRRIEAVTGRFAGEYCAKKKEAEAAAERAQSQRDALKEAQGQRIQRLLADTPLYLARAADVAGVKVIAEIVDGVDAGGLRILCDKMRPQAQGAVIMLGLCEEAKASFVVLVPDALVKRGISAGDLAKALSGVVEGSGGGKPAFAQGGGKAPGRMKEAFGKAIDILKEKIR